MADKHSKAARAKVAPVRIGTYELQGLMDHEGAFFVAVPQIADVFQFDRQQASRTLKRLLGEGFQFDRVSSELNPKAVNAIPLDEFGAVIRKFAYAGDLKAQAMVDALSQATLHQVFCDAFGQKFDADDRQDFLKARMSGKSVRSDFEAAIARWIDRHPESSENTRAFAYINATQRIYMGMWGKCRKSVATEMGLSTGDDLRSALTLQQLAAVQTVENLAIRLMDVADMEPIAAVDEAVNRAIAGLIFAAN